MTCAARKPRVNSHGTTITPPPTPASTATMPIGTPMTVECQWRPPENSRGERKNISIAMASMNTPKNRASATVGSWSASAAPMTLPMASPGASRCASSQRTPSSRMCANTADPELITMNASELPSARCMAYGAVSGSALK